MSEAKVTSEAVQNYLKAIYLICQRGDGAQPQEIATHMHVSAPGVSKMLRYLDKHQLIQYTRYQPVHLSAVGEKIALEVIRHHRLIELYLMESLGYGWEQVHSEAERLEHHISEEFETCIERLLGYPTFDPHGDPIPTRDGKIEPQANHDLESQSLGTQLVVRRVTDGNEALLIYLGEHGIRPGVALEILEREPFGGSLRLQLREREVRISLEASRHIFVEPLPVDTLARP